MFIGIYSRSQVSVYRAIGPLVVGLEATCLYELSECSEEALVVPDYNLADTDLYLESSDLDNHTTLTLNQGM